MKKHIAGFCAVLVLLVTLAMPVYATEGYEPTTAPTAEAAYVVNLDTNIVVYEKNSETSMEAASLTKLMTMILMLKSYQDQLDTVTVTAPGYIYDILYGTGASTADIWRGETHTLRTLLYCMELPSANEAAYIVADYIGGGSIDNFVAMMNTEAKAIGCTGTTFTDPCGLDPGNKTTARDAYLLLRTAMSYDAFVQAAAAPNFQVPASIKHDAPYNILTTNKMLTQGSSYFRGYAQGGKTGSLNQGWQNFASWHTKDGISYLCVVLHSSDSIDNRPALVETAGLVDWAFDTFTIAPALDTTQPLTELPVQYSTQTDTVMLYPADDMMTLLPRDTGAALTELSYDLPETLSAPLQQGDVVGTVTLSIKGEKLGTVDLVAGSTIERNNVLYTLSLIGDFFSGRYFKVVLTLTLLVVAAYAGLWFFFLVRATDSRQKKRRKS